MTRGRKLDEGFTLIELLVVVVLVGIIVAPIAASFFVALRNIGGTVDEFTSSHDLYNATSFFVSDTQDADEVFDSRVDQVAVNLNGVRFANSMTGWVAGDYGVVLVSNDQGVSFSRVATGSTEHLFGIGLVRGDDKVAWAVGAKATILKTTDGGSNWVAQSVPAGVTATLRRAHFVSASQGLVVGDGGTILKTTDGGSTWTKKVSNTALDLKALSFRDSSNGVAVGSNGITLYTSNFGDTWAQQTSRPPITTTLRGVYIKDDGAGWVVGDRDSGSGFAIATCSKGCTKAAPVWSGVADTGTLNNFRAVAGVSKTNVWAVAEDGIIVSCTVSCASASGVWVQEPSGSDKNINGIYAADATHVWAVSDAGGVLRFVSNRWAQQAPPSGFTRRLNSVEFLDFNNGFAVGAEGSAIATSNGGATWVAQSTGTAQDLLALDASSSSKVMAVGLGGVVRMCTANCTAANATWIGQVSTTLNNLHGLWWKDSSTVWTVGAGGTMRICTTLCDGGAAVWATQVAVPPVLSTLRAVQGVSAGEAYAVGDAGTLLTCSSNCDKATAGWQAAVSGTSENLNAILCVSKSECYAVGNAGTILTCKSNCNQSASTWVTEDSGTTLDLHKVTRTGSTLYAVGKGGTILFSTDGGSTWVPEAAPASSDLRGVSATSSSNQWAVGAAATILTTSTGGSASWLREVDDSLEEVSARVCEGTDAILIGFWSTDPDGAEVSFTYLVRDSGGERVLVRQLCSRSRTADGSGPFTLVNEITVVRDLASTNDPTLECLDSGAGIVPCGDAVKLRLTFKKPGGTPFSITGARRDA